MSQYVVKQKLIAYLKITAPNTSQALCSILENGHCLGFSSVFGAMYILGKMAWWLEVLVLITNWDEDSNKLDKIAYISHGKPYTLATLCELTINYIVAHQGSINLILNTEGLPQTKINLHELFCMIRSTSPLTLLNENNTLATLNHGQKLSGYFTCLQLQSIITPDLLKDTIVLVANFVHIINIHYSATGNCYLSYDSNYDHANSQTIIKKFNYKNELIREIVSILGHNLIFKTLQQQAQQRNFTSFDTFKTPDITAKMLREKGIHMMIIYEIDRFCALLHDPLHKHQTIELIIKNLTVKHDGGMSLFVFLSSYGHILELLLLQNSHELCLQLQKSISLRDTDNEVGLIRLSNMPQPLSQKILQLITSLNSGVNTIASCLLNNGICKETPLERICISNLRLAGILIKIISQHNLFIPILAESISKNTLAANVILKIVDSDYPQHLFDIIQNLDNTSAYTALLLFDKVAANDFQFMNYTYFIIARYLINRTTESSDILIVISNINKNKILDDYFSRTTGQTPSCTLWQNLLDVALVKTNVLNDASASDVRQKIEAEKWIHSTLRFSNRRPTYNDELKHKNSHYFFTSPPSNQPHVSAPHPVTLPLTLPRR